MSDDQSELERFVRRELVTKFKATYADEVESIKRLYGDDLTPDHHAWSLFESRAMGALVLVIETKLQELSRR